MDPRGLRGSRRSGLVLALAFAVRLLYLWQIRSSPYFCGQWQASQVSLAGRRLCTGVGIGRG